MPPKKTVKCPGVTMTSPVQKLEGLVGLTLFVVAAHRVPPVGIPPKPFVM
jgi:hypothetical protein